MGSQPVNMTEGTESSSRDVLRAAAQSCTQGTSREMSRAHTRLWSAAAGAGAAERSRVSVDTAWQADTGVTDDPGYDIQLLSCRNGLFARKHWQMCTLEDKLSMEPG